jgi:hypothetical protein
LNAALVIAHLFAGTTVWEPRYLFFAYRPHMQVCLCCWFWGANVLVFEKFKINHVLVLGTSPDPRYYLHPSSILTFSAVWSILALSCFWLQVSHAWIYVTDEPESPPVLLWGLLVGFLFLPTRRDWTLPTTRLRLLRTFVRVLLAGLVPVMWRDVLLANILSSLVKPLVDLNHFVCYSWTESFFEEGHGAEALKLNLVLDECGCMPNFGFSSHSHGCVPGGHTNFTEVADCDEEDSATNMDYCNNCLRTKTALIVRCGSNWLTGRVCVQTSGWMRQ